MSKKEKNYIFSTGFTVDKENTDITELIESLYQEIAIKSNMNYSFQDMKEEIENLISQMTPEELKTHFTESLFMNTITYENQMMEVLLEKFSKSDEAD